LASVRARRYSIKGNAHHHNASPISRHRQTKTFVPVAALHDQMIAPCLSFSFLLLVLRSGHTHLSLFGSSRLMKGEAKAFGGLLSRSVLCVHITHPKHIDPVQYAIEHFISWCGGVLLCELVNQSMKSTTIESSSTFVASHRQRVGIWDSVRILKACCST